MYPARAGLHLDRETEQMISIEAVEEFSSHFNKVDLENQFLKMEGALAHNDDDKIEVVQSLFRELHSLKGTAGMLKFESATVFLHTFEDALGVVSNNIRRIVAVKKNEVFDFFLQSLDLIERLINQFTSHPETVLKDEKELFSFYIRMIVEARLIMDQQDEFFDFAELDEDLF